MVVVSGEVIGIIRKFINMISAGGLHPERVILFGSYANGTENMWSDIDIAIVSQDFQGVRFYDRRMVNPYLIKVDTRIEPHPFRPDDFNEEDPFVREILKQGIEIRLS